ncbi:MBL fold metallo-hydrolase [Avibacterium sp. 20-129]|uniref:MBL fold metallo-hydrolase n=1 Tax=Avibacterium sp. 20-129 TaxID=2911525 RepID=UPI002248460D|nr:MBL fold metallo-hydrolase [Avibacterium sp. 20-129]MCW9699120.1 MBL fold metallo-hydrolase [Avibacterium sp. 20-129]
MNKKFLTLLVASSLGFSVLNTNAVAEPTYYPPENAIPMKLTQVPGYYRVMVGEFEVTALYDGAASLNAELFSKYSKFNKKELEKMINDEFSLKTENGGVNTAIIAFLINTGKNLILVDAGKGNVQDPIFVNDQGSLISSLNAAGYSADQIDIILPTHMHADHFSGVTVDGKRVFPNATIYLPNQEKAFWLDKSIDQIPNSAKPFVRWAREAAEPYIKANKIKFYNSGDEVIPSVKSVPLFGHTPGHSGFEITSNNETILIWGDLMHNHAIQMQHPEVAVDFDANSISARKSRLNILPKIAKRKILVAGAHLPFPGIGHIRIENNGYRWIPIEYQPISKN